LLTPTDGAPWRRDEPSTAERPAPELLPAGHRVGPYEILATLGHGGMGSVYLARHVEFGQRVALKVVTARLGPAFVRRFELEREILAGLDHPNIVRLLGGGTTDEGHPYLVMEPIGGDDRALHDYCRTTAADFPAIARLVRDAARGVAFAHGQGVIHRDLKPSNILVTPEGVAKVNDFGLARRLADASETTAGQVLGTRGYIAPEQFGDSPDRNLPGVDVYALGAILYRLLTGRLPREESSPLPGREAPGPIPPRRLDRRIPRDLETIALRALETNPRDRIGGAAELAGELDRYLGGRPLTIRPVGPWETLGKWGYRNRRPLAAWAASMALLSVIFAGQTLSQYRRQARATRLSESLLAELRWASEHLLQAIPAGTDEDLKFRVALARASDIALADPRFQIDPRGAGNSHYQLARAYQDRGDQASAIPHFRRAIELLANLPPTAPEPGAKAGEVRFDLFRAWKGLASSLRRRKDFPGAARAGGEATRLIQDLVAAFPADPDWANELAIEHLEMGQLAQEVGDQAEARRHLVRGKSIAEEVVARSPRTARYGRTHCGSIHALAALNRRAGRLDLAEAGFREAIRLADELLVLEPSSFDNLELAGAYRRELLLLLKEQRRWAEAERELHQIAGIYDDLPAPYRKRPGMAVRTITLQVLRAEIQAASDREAEARSAIRGAISDLESLLAKQPAHRPAKEALADLLSNGPIPDLRDPERASDLLAAGGD
jgi:serine/threonine-protein kinase